MLRCTCYGCASRRLACAASYFGVVPTLRRPHKRGTGPPPSHAHTMETARRYNVVDSHGVLVCSCATVIFILPITDMDMSCPPQISAVGLSKFHRACPPSVHARTCTSCRWCTLRVNRCVFVYSVYPASIHAAARSFGARSERVAREYAMLCVCPVMEGGKTRSVLSWRVACMRTVCLYTYHPRPIHLRAVPSSLPRRSVSPGHVRATR